MFAVLFHSQSTRMMHTSELAACSKYFLWMRPERQQASRQVDQGHAHLIFKEREPAPAAAQALKNGMTPG